VERFGAKGSREISEGIGGHGERRGGKKKACQSSLAAAVRMEDGEKRKLFAKVG